MYTVIAMKFSQTYTYKLRSLMNGMDKLFDRTLKRFADIGLTQLMVLMAIDEQQSPSQRDVSKFLQLSPGAISRQIEIIREKDWITIRDHPQDRREQVIELTSAGQIALQNCLDVLEKHVFHIFCDSNNSLDLMGHIDILTSHVKKANLADGVN